MICTIKRLGQIQKFPPSYLIWLRDLNMLFVSLLAGLQ